MMTPTLSIVSGTYNRLPLLQRMIASVRKTWPASMPYEIVLVDGGSTDGSLEWARQQPDVRLIEHGDLRGAIRAFTDGAYAAQGKYVALANDDVEFLSGSLVRAFAHLEDTPTVGAVAFMDNRQASGRVEVEGGYGYQRINATPAPVPYVQVGMVRKWLGDLVGWWGAHDPGMANSRTYGGDAYLSARLWELGYSSDVLRGVRVRDYVHSDGLRERNVREEQQRPSGYYTRYPQAVRIPPSPIIPTRDDDAALRVLYLPAIERGMTTRQAGKRGLRDAFGRRGSVYEVDYVNASPPVDLARLCQVYRPDVLFMQLHAANEITAHDIAQARAAWPDMIIVNWIGDVWEKCYADAGMLNVVRQIDLLLGVNDDALRQAEAATGTPAAYWQNAFEHAEDKPLTEEHDVVFLANAYSPKRQQVGETIMALGGGGDGLNVLIHGLGWRFGAATNSTYHFQAGRDVYRSAKLAVGDNEFGARGFVSNRFFEALAAGGALLLQQHIPGAEELLGVVDGVHYVEWTDLKDLTAKIQYWSDPKRDKRRRQIAAAGAAYVRECHTFDARVRQLFGELIPGLPDDTP